MRAGCGTYNGEASGSLVALGLVDVYLVVCAVQVACEHHWLALLQLLHVPRQSDVPPRLAHSVVQPPQALAAVGHIAVDQVEVLQLLWLWRVIGVWVGGGGG